jgi:hypothetical protein
MTMHEVSQLIPSESRQGSNLYSMVARNKILLVCSTLYSNAICIRRSHRLMGLLLLRRHRLPVQTGRRHGRSLGSAWLGFVWLVWCHHAVAAPDTGAILV